MCIWQATGEEGFLGDPYVFIMLTHFFFLFKFVVSITDLNNGCMEINYSAL